MKKLKKSLVISLLFAYFVPKNLLDEALKSC